MATDSKAAIGSMLARAEKLVADLAAIYQRDLEKEEVSLEAQNLTHEVLEKCSNTLDQCMTAVFEREIAPKLSTLPKRGGYFPTSRDETAYRAAMGKWGASNLETILPDLDRKLRSLQPFVHPAANAIFARVRDLANKKHTGLVPQKRTESRTVNVTRRGQGGGGVTWGSGVTFGSGVSVMGAPIDPRTQMPVPTPGVKVKVSRWVSFILQDGGEDALAFCKAAVVATRRAFETLL